MPVRWMADSDGRLGPGTVVSYAAISGRLKQKAPALPALATRPLQRIPYAAFLRGRSGEHARSIIRNPTPTARRALSALWPRRAIRDRARICCIHRARNNEQDPVRCAMLSALAELPPAHGVHVPRFSTKL